jgi:hypothetical protein
MRRRVQTSRPRRSPSPCASLDRAAAAELKPKTKRRLDDSLHEARAIAATQATASSMSFRICWINRSLPAFRSRTHICMARTYLVFGDIDGKLDVLRVVRALSTEGPLSRPQTATLTLRWPAASFALLTLLREPLLSGKFVNPVHIPFHKRCARTPVCSRS